MPPTTGAFTGDRTKVKQLDPGKYRDTAAGDYYTGTSWDKATNWGSDSTFGEGTKAPSPISPANGPAVGPLAGDSNPTVRQAPISYGTDTRTQPSGPGGYAPTTPGATPPSLPSNPWAPRDPPVQSAVRLPDIAAAATSSTRSASTATPTATPGGTYNTTPYWQDPYHAPSPGEQGYEDWMAANPGYQMAKPASTGIPTDPNYVAQWVAYHSQQPGANPSTKNDPQYWINKIIQTGGWQGDNAGYWSGPQGMYRAEGAPEGGGTGTPNPNAVMPYDQALQYVQQSVGRALSPQEIAAAFAKFGGNTSSSFTQQSLAPVVAYFKGGGAGGGGATSGGAGNGNPTPNGNPTGFADPAYQQLMDLVTQRLKQLGQPVQFPQLDEYMSMLKSNEAAAKARAGTFADQLTQRVGQLQQPLLTDANVANQRALASNNLLAQRDATLKNQRERRFASGFEPTSGLLAGDERAINENTSNAQANIDAQLQAGSIRQDEQRRNQATQLQGLVQQALQGGDVTALQSQAQIADLENQVFNIGEQRARESLTTGNIPVDLTNMGFANANTAANAGGDPMQSIMQLLQLANGQQGLQQANSNSNMSALAWLLQQALG